MNFLDKVDAAQLKNNSLVCVGLDPDPAKLPKKLSIFQFNKLIIDQTADLVCCYKPQIAFYAASGIQGLADLQKTIIYIKDKYQIPVILDAKRGDIGNTSQMYAKEVFDVFDADAVTVNPYCGFDSMLPFLERKERGVIVICRTSNNGAIDFQDLRVNREPLYLKVGRKILTWSKKYPNIMLEIGSTWPKEIYILRKIAPKIVFLIAGIGAQGGDLKLTLKNGLRDDKKGLIISASRSIIYAQDPRNSAQALRDEINRYR